MKYFNVKPPQMPVSYDTSTSTSPSEIIGHFARSSFESRYEHHCLNLLIGVLSEQEKKMKMKQFWLNPQSFWKTTFCHLSKVPARLLFDIRHMSHVQSAVNQFLESARMLARRTWYTSCTGHVVTDATSWQKTSWRTHQSTALTETTSVHLPDARPVPLHIGSSYAQFVLQSSRLFSSSPLSRAF